MWYGTGKAVCWTWVNPLFPLFLILISDYLKQSPISVRGWSTTAKVRGRRRMWVKSGETVSEISSKLSPISLYLEPSWIAEFAFSRARRFSCTQQLCSVVFLYLCAKLCSILCNPSRSNFVCDCVHFLRQRSPNPLCAQCPGNVQLGDWRGPEPCHHDHHDHDDHHDPCHHDIEEPFLWTRKLVLYSKQTKSATRRDICQNVYTSRLWSIIFFTRKV